jgi:hypothetical protein
LIRTVQHPSSPGTNEKMSQWQPIGNPFEFFRNRNKNSVFSIAYATRLDFSLAF